MAMKIKHNGNWITIPTSEGIIKVKYSELKALIDAGTLKAGSNYQITDFVTTVTDATGSKFVSLAKPFNVLVYAQTSKKLGMYGKVIAASDASDYYFKDSALDKWLIKYDVAGTGFDWVNPSMTGFTGVIYYMEDEYGNVAPYDFKNIKFQCDINVYYNATLGYTTDNEAKNLTIASATPVTLKALKGTLVNYDLFVDPTDTTGLTVGYNPTFTFGKTDLTIDSYTPAAGTALANIVVDSKKYEYWAGKNIVVSDSVTWYAWINDEGSYLYTSVSAPTAGTDKARGNITAYTFGSTAAIAVATALDKVFTFGSTTVDDSMTGTASNNVIKNENPSNFSYVYLSLGAKNVNVHKNCSHITILGSNASNIEFKGNSYLTLIAGAQTTESIDNYTFVANYGGDASLSKAFRVEFDLAVETLVGNDNYGNIVAKNVLSATRNFYQRNEPLEANEGDLWFTIED